MLYLGVDLGGTNIKAALVDETGSLVREAAAPTGLPRSAQSICDDIASPCLARAAFYNYARGRPRVTDRTQESSHSGRLPPLRRNLTGTGPRPPRRKSPSAWRAVRCK